MFRTIALWVILGLMTPPALSDNLAARVSQVLDATPLIDGHNDLSLAIQAQDQQSINWIGHQSKFDLD